MSTCNRQSERTQHDATQHAHNYGICSLLADSGHGLRVGPADLLMLVSCARILSSKREAYTCLNRVGMKVYANTRTRTKKHGCGRCFASGLSRHMLRATAPTVASQARLLDPLHHSN